MDTTEGDTKANEELGEKLNRRSIQKHHYVVYNVTCAMSMGLTGLLWGGKTSRVVIRVWSCVATLSFIYSGVILINDSGPVFEANYKSKIHTYGDNICILLAILHVVTIFFSSFSIGGQLNLLIKEIHEIENNLDQTNKSNNACFINTLTWFTIIYNVSIFLVICISYIAMGYMFHSFNFALPLWLLFCVIYENHLLSALVFRFVHLMEVNTNLFMRVNKELDSVANDASGVANDGSGVGNNTPKFTKKVHSLLDLADLRSRIAHTSQCVVDIHSLSLALFVALQFGRILFAALRFARAFTSSSNPVFLFGPTISTVLSLLMLLAVSHSADRNITQARRTPLLLYRIANRATDPAVSRAAAATSARLLQSSPRLQAAGLFNLDATLVFNVVGFVTTFLTILLQFVIDDQPLEIMQVTNYSSNKL